RSLRDWALVARVAAGVFDANGGAARDPHHEPTHAISEFTTRHRQTLIGETTRIGLVGGEKHVERSAVDKLRVKGAGRAVRHLDVDVRSLLLELLAEIVKRKPQICGGSDRDVTTRSPARRRIAPHPPAGCSGDTRDDDQRDGYIRSLHTEREGSAPRIPHNVV